MRVSNLFGETLREAPAEVDAISHQLLVRAGYVRQLAAGIFSYLPLAQRSLAKLEGIVRVEMEAIGAQELRMPVVHPAEPWQASGRWDTWDESMVRFQDRRERDMLLAVTHEEIVAELARSELNSYRQLPKLVYQIQTKFRDEARPRAGLIRAREFVMKDSYSLDRDEAGLKQQYIAHYDAYFRIMARMSLPVIAVGSDTGMMGGEVAHEFMYLTPLGEDTLVRCVSCGYAANQEVARFVKAPGEQSMPQPLQKAYTPGTETTEALTALLGVEPSQTSKAVFFMGAYGVTNKLIVSVVRGDMNVNPTQVLNLSGARALRPAQAEEIRAAGMEPGYGSPIGIEREDVMVIVDDLVMRSTNLVAGANEPNYHFLHANAGRDYQPDVVGHIAQAEEGAACVVCGGGLSVARGVEVGNIFQLGARYTAALSATYTDEAGAARPIMMGSYGIGIGRLFACIAEEHRDARGLALPIAVAPYQVALVALGRKEATCAAAEQLYADLLDAGIEVLYDDRDVSPGVKFADADLRGLPLRITISDRSLAKGGVEIKRRRQVTSTDVALGSTVTVALMERDALLRDEMAGLAEVSIWREEEQRRMLAVSRA